MKRTLKYLCENEELYSNIITTEDNDAILEIVSGSAYTWSITLRNATCIPDNYDCLCFSKDSLIEKEDNTYILKGTKNNWDDDIYDDPFAISFTDAIVNINVFNATEQPFMTSPWLHLFSIASVILDKYYLPGDYLNDKEKALMPLLSELCQLCYWARIPEEYQNLKFPLLKECIRHMHYDELLAPLDKIASEYENYKKIHRLKDSYISTLNNIKYEPLWRHLYNLIVESQASYPSRINFYCTKEQLEEKRIEIQKLMEQYGYLGTYPDFVKHGKITGLHLAESYDLSYFVGHEKNVIFRIHCTEDYFNEHISIQFLCGTEMLRKQNISSDIYACTFKGKGRRFFNTVTYEECFQDTDNDNNISSHNLETYIHIATKRAELKKLSKEESIQLTSVDISYLRLFLSIFIIMGGLFGIFMTVAFIAMAALCALLFGQPEVIPSMITEIPWWICLVFCWIGFGGIMGIITVLVKRK